MIATMVLAAVLLTPVALPSGGDNNGDDTCQKSCGWFSPSFEDSPVNAVFCTVPDACKVGDPK